jgi:hypothetical protein
MKFNENEFVTVASAYYATVKASEKRNYYVSLLFKITFHARRRLFIHHT